MRPTTAKLFLAIPLDDTWIKALKPFYQEYYGRKSQWRVVPESNWHVTVVFIGNVERVVLPRLQSALAQVNSPTFSLGQPQLEVFPPEQQTMLWVKFGQQPEFVQLVQQCRELIAPVTTIQDRHDMTVPHITLVRSYQPINQTDLPTLQLPPMLPVTKVTLYSAVMEQFHPVYQPVMSVSLQ